MNAMTRFAAFPISGCLLLLAGASPLDGQGRAPSPPLNTAESVETLTVSGLPVEFIENRGQWNSAAMFVARQGHMAASLETGAVKLSLAADRPAEVSLTFDGASKQATLTGEQRRSGHYNFFVGNDPRKWRSNVAAFGAVRYRGLYDGVDLRVLQRGGRLEYDLLLAPGANLDRVVIRTAGASNMVIEADGSLLLETAAGPLRQRAPITWEELADGTTRRIESRFRKIDAQRYTFEVPGRDTSLPLVIDPGLEWSTFLGGSNRDEVRGLALTRDGTGDVVIAGTTFSNDFPTGPPAGYLGASPLIPFVARLNASGTSLVYATVFGSTNGNVSYGFGLTLDASGAPIVVGETNGADFPTTPGAFQPRFNEPATTINRGWDAFVTRFDATGSQMVFSTYLGAPPIFDPTFPGSVKGGEERASAVVVDAFDNVIVAGATTSDGFPTTPGAYDRTKESLIVQVTDPDGTIHSHTDAFIARLNPTGTQLTYSTFLGAQADDVVRDMVIDSQGVLTLVGLVGPLETFDGQGNRTQHGVPFPTTADAIHRTYKGASDIFVTRLRLDGAGANDLKYSTMLGATYIEDTTSMALDPNNPELVTISGHTRSWDFPTTAGAWRRAALFNVEGNPYYSGFLMRFRFPATGGGSLVWSTLITGESTGQYAESVVVDPSGDVILVGNDIAGTYPTTDRSYRRVPLKGSFISRFSGDGKNLLYSTVLHKSSGALVFTMKAVSTGPRSVVVAGSTLFPDHPTTPGAFDRVFGSNGTSDGFHTYDGFVSKLSLDPNATADTTANAPALVSPANGASFALNSPLTLDWTDVTDASGVQFYQVQVAGNADFLTGFSFFNLAQGVWTVSQAAGSTGDEGIQYWRVRTLDGVNNFSPWSEVRRFTVGAPTWTNFAATSLTPNGVVGGSTVLGKVHILNVAPAGGQVYTLASDNPSVASVPPSVTIPAGQSSATYTVTTHSVSVSTPVRFTVWSEGNGDHPILWVDPAPDGPPGTATLSSLALTPSSVTGGAASQGTVTLSGPAPTGGAVISLSSSSSVAGVAGVPGSVTVASGATSATFTVTTTDVTASTVATVTGTLDGTSRTANLTITPAGGGGGGATGFDSPTANAPDTGGDGNGFQSSPVSAHADDAAIATDTNSGTGTSTSCTSTAKDKHRFYNYGFSIPTDMSITGIEVRLDARADSTSGSPRMCVQLSWDGGTTWTTAKATATLGTGMTTFTLGSATDTWGRTWSPANFANAAFRVRVINVAGSTARDFFLDWVAVRPHYAASAPAGLSAVSESPSTVTGGNPSTGTVTLTAAAPAGGFPVPLSSTSSAATVPASVTVAQGATSATFAIPTTTVAASTAVTITASAGGVTRTTTLTVTPPAPPASLSAVSLNPTSVVGGTSSQGTVTLTSAAPVGGLAVTLSSNTAATVPGSVTVAQGTATATFTATTTAVGASTPVTITATNAGVTRTASLTVTPPATNATLTVAASGRSGERVTSSPAGVNVAVGSSGSAAFAVGTQIRLSVTNGRDAIWSGACSSGGDKTATCTFTLTAAASVSANVQ